MTTPTCPEEGSQELKFLGDAMNRVIGILLDRQVALAEALAVFELCYARAAVARQGGNLSQAAADLGIHRNTLRTKLQRNGSSGQQASRERK